MKTAKILFLCSANACRSQMAEGFAHAKNVKNVQIQSAGSIATRVNDTAKQVMKEVGINISRQKSKAIDDLASLNFDIVITLCSQAAESCPVFPGNPQKVEWNLDDPYTAKGGEKAVLEAFRKVRDDIGRLVDDFFDRGYLAALKQAKNCESMILNNIHDGIIAHDTERRIFYFNKAAEEITGYKRSEVINKDCHKVFPGNFCGGKCLFCEGAKLPAFDSKTEEVRITTKTGEQRITEMFIKTMTDGRNRPAGVLVSFRDLTRERRLAKRVGEARHFSGIIGRDKKMLELFDLINDLADTNVPVLIQGDSGTGKELVAAAIHNEGSRANKLFVPVNCGALPEALLESELFGHVKGAFTGAIRDKKGRFELADGGTIFLDEIGDISPAMQVKLLRVLQEGEFERVGSEKTQKVNVRVISATNKDIGEEIAEARFREDLYYRLSVVPIMLPPLRKRRNDIPLLVDHVLVKTLKEIDRKDIEVSPEALDIMMSYEWPGNIRELQNWIQFALVKCRTGMILPKHLPPSAPYNQEALQNKRQRKLTIESVQSALRQCNGNKVKAAKILGVGRATLYRFLDDTSLNK